MRSCGFRCVRGIGFSEVLKRWMCLTSRTVSFEFVSSNVRSDAFLNHLKGAFFREGVGCVEVSFLLGQDFLDHSETGGVGGLDRNLAVYAFALAVMEAGLSSGIK